MKAVQPEPEAIECQVFRCSRQAEMYLYVPLGADLEELPDGLLRFLGRVEPVLELTLTPERRLARAEVAEVMAKLREQGYFVQMPPEPFRPHLHYSD